MVSALITAAAAFVGSNIDDLFVLMLLFAVSENKAAVRRGYVAASLCVCALSFLAAYTLQQFAVQYIKLFGFVVLFLGLKTAICGDKHDDELPERNRYETAQAAQTFLLTLAGSADNIGLYIPLFARFDKTLCIAAVSVMAAMALLWCGVSRRLSSLPMLSRLLTERKRLTVSLIYILLGIYIIIG